MPMHTKSFIPIPTKNERNAPKAACIAEAVSFLQNIFSPINAPTKGPNNGPMGNAMKNPTNIPINAPQPPALLPPNFRVIIGVMKKSTTVTTTITSPQTIKVVVEK